MKLRNLKIGYRLYGGFGLVLFLAIAMGIVAIFGMQKLADLTSNMYQHPLAVSNAVRDVKVTCSPKTDPVVMLVFSYIIG